MYRPFRISHRSNADGSRSLIADRKLIPNEVLEWTTISLHWQRFVACRPYCVKTERSVGFMGAQSSVNDLWPPVRYLEAEAAASSSLQNQSGNDAASLPATVEDLPDANEPSAAKELPTNTKFQFNKLPQEIQDEIFRLAIADTDPYTLNAVVYYAPLQKNVTDVEPHTSLACWDPRTWKDISFFQLCSTSRRQAIRVWGHSKTTVLPFNKDKDTVKLHINEEAGQFGSCRGFLHLNTLKHMTSQIPRNVPLNLRLVSIYSSGRGGEGRRCGQRERCLGRCPSLHLERRTAELPFLTGIKHLHIKIAPLFNVIMPWSDIWAFVEKLSPAVETFTLLTASTDRCDLDPSVIIDAENPVQDLWQGADLMPIQGFIQYATQRPNMFPHLRFLEIRADDSICRRDVAQWTHLQDPMDLLRLPVSRSEYFDGRGMSPLVIRVLSNTEFWD